MFLSVEDLIKVLKVSSLGGSLPLYKVPSEPINTVCLPDKTSAVTPVSILLLLVFFQS
jgi:hypothetical protein